MRSLYVDDIAGCRSKPTILSKDFYLQRHQQEINRSPFKAQSKYEWYVPLPKPPPNQFLREPYRSTIKLISEHTGLSGSMHLENTKIRMPIFQGNKSSVNPEQVIRVKSQSKPIEENPYFPHRIRDPFDSSHSNRYTGNREWNYSAQLQVKLPTIGRKGVVI